MPSLLRIQNVVESMLAKHGLAGGDCLFVSSTHANASDAAGKGLQPESPLSTVDYAIGRAAIENVSCIVVMPRHTETLTAAGSVTMDVANVKIVGIGTGRDRPTFNYTTAAAASFNVTAANCAVINCVFTPIGVDAVTAAVNVSGSDFYMAGCEMELADATNQATLGILTASGADRMFINDCWLHGSANDGTATAIRIAAGKDIRVINTHINGNFTTTLGAIDNSAAVTGLVVKRCVLSNNTASSTKAIVCHGSTTADLSDNIYRILSGTAPVTCAAGYGAGRSYYTAAVGVTAGTLI